MRHIPVELRKAICDNDLLVFVGAGLSYNLLNAQGQAIKGWSNLVENILEDLKNRGYDACYLIPLK